jgi:hypothetical protein
MGRMYKVALKSGVMNLRLVGDDRKWLHDTKVVPDAGAVEL